MITIIDLLVLYVGVMIGVAFLTLMERKILGYIHIRLGPNSVGVEGIFQPFGDAIKLFIKEQSMPLNSNYILYYVSPVLNFFMSLIVWMLIPYSGGFFEFEFGLLFFLCCMSLGVYSLMLVGWSSNSKYSLLGSLRGVAQMISYEVSLALVLICFVFFVNSYNLVGFVDDNYGWGFICWPMMLVWVISCLAENNRVPFDFAEGESELVSGFNVDYSGGGFVLIFLSEYSSMLYMSMIICLLFFSWDFGELFFYVKVIMVGFFYIWVRGSFPRFRYDKLMYLCWVNFLPVVLSYVIFMVFVEVFIF
uniref:NADH-ubiquinone oxidoreductase chain 1 n=1 Tax=Nocticola sp. JW1 9/1 TaxID=2093475 RepID=A0A2P1H9I5_9NEOP|nr:NADH dehydrogenase subunit 1 [Nocticola sp. JW1 9/1]